jgi:hypothetical protein
MQTPSPTASPLVVVLFLAISSWVTRPLPWWRSMPYPQSSSTGPLTARRGLQSDQPLCPAPAALQTGKLCKVVKRGDMQHIQCNITDPSQASAFVYNGTAFTYNGIPLTNPGLSQPLYIGGTGTSATVKPAGELKLAVAAQGDAIDSSTWCCCTVAHRVGNTRAGSVQDAEVCAGG